jgi:hypothetical protein
MNEWYMVNLPNLFKYLTLNNESLITCQSINSNNNLFVYTSLEQFHNISDNGCRHVLSKEIEKLNIKCIFIYIVVPII